MTEYEEKLNENKNIILRNIQQGKQAGVNKVSAVFAVSKRDELRKNICDKYNEFNIGNLFLRIPRLSIRN